MKQCPKCQQTKPFSEFWKDKRKKSGCGTYCKPCAYLLIRPYQKLHKDRLNMARVQKKLNKKQKAIERLGGKCLDCGEKFPSAVYDFHHIDPSKKDFDPSTILTMSNKRIEEEILNWVLLCANCHRMRHNRDKAYYDPPDKG